MKKKKPSFNTKSQKIEEKEITPMTANELLANFLKDNKIELDIEVAEPGVAFIGDGFVLTDKQLLKIKAKYATKPTKK